MKPKPAPRVAPLKCWEQASQRNGNGALEMLAALPLGFLTTRDFTDTAQSTKRAPKCLGNSIWQLRLDKDHRNDLAWRRPNTTVL